MEILIIQTAFPGDLFLSLPLVKQTRRYFPDARLSLMCRKGLGSLFLENHLVDELIEIQKGDKHSYKRALKQFRDRKVDVVISPHRSFRTAVFVRSLKAHKSVGYKRWWNGFFFNERLRYSVELPDALRQLELLKAVSTDFATQWAHEEASLKNLRGSKYDPLVRFDELDFPEWMSGQIKAWEPEGRTVCVAPGSVWPTKRWRVEYFSDLVGRLLRSGIRVQIVGAGADQPECDRVALENPAAENLCGKTSLTQLLDLFQKAQLLVSNDSGAMHVAAAVGLPTLAIFGPTVPEFGYRPWQKNVRLMQTQLPCRPCSAHGTLKCPINTHDCMKLISVDMVFAEVQQMMEVR